MRAFISRQRLWVLAEHWRREWGWPGALGALALLAAAWLGWGLQRALPDEGASNPSASPAVEARAPAASRPVDVDLWAMAEAPAILTIVQNVLAEHGLAWDNADFQWQSASDAHPRSLVLSLSLKAPYPAMRDALLALSRDVPGLTVKELQLQRLAPEQEVLDARLKLMLVWADAPNAAPRTP